MTNTRLVPLRSGLAAEASGSLTQSLKISGSPAASGIGLGPVKRTKGLPSLSRENLQTILAEHSQPEHQKLLVAIDQAKRILQTSRDQKPAEEQDLILETQYMALGDPDFLRRLQQLTAGGVSPQEFTKYCIPADISAATSPEELLHFSAASAVQIVILRNSDKLRKAQDPHFNARAADFDAVGGILLSLLDGQSPDFFSETIRQSESEAKVLVARHISPAEAACIDKSGCAGIVTKEGTLFDHTAIIAKALGIPYVIGVETDQIPANATVLVDGYSGNVIINPSETDLALVKGSLEALESSKVRLPIKQRAPMTKDGTPISLMATMDFANQAEEIKDLRAQGLGLYRTELELLKHGGKLSEEEMFEIYSKLLTTFSPDPVVFRIFDIGGDKLHQSFSFAPGENPALGFRGVRVMLNPEYEQSHLIPQMRAILRASKFGQANILVPMVNDAGEVRKVRQILNRENTFLNERGVETGEFIKLGAMIETPAAGYSALHIIRETDFTNLGTNDLTQYTLAIDRNNPLVAHGYAPHHPAMLETYRRIAKSKLKANQDRGDEAPKPCRICGDSASNILLLPIFVGLGFRSFSVAPSKIEELNYSFSLLDSNRCKQFVESLRDIETGAQDADQVYERLQDFQTGLHK